MKRLASFLIATLTILFAKSQKPFFKSSHQFSGEQIQALYASVNLQDSLVIFNAPDYHLYAYDKTNGREKWRYYLKRKSDIPPFFAAGFIWATNGNAIIKLDPASGNPVKTLQVKTLETQPLVKNGILYFTGICDGGSIIAYDMNEDSVLWKRFIAHGSSKVPYYMANKIVANAESDNWIEINYDGTLTTAGCGTSEDVFASELPCVKNFFALTHDKKEIKGKLAEKCLLDSYSPADIITTEKHSFILNKGHLFVLGNKFKIKMLLRLDSLYDQLEEDSEGPAKILGVNDEVINILYSNHFISYNYRDRKLLNLIDLSSWGPHQVLLDGNKLWLISKKDGRLHGLTID